MRKGREGRKLLAAAARTKPEEGEPVYVRQRGFETIQLCLDSSVERVTLVFINKFLEHRSLFLL